MVCGRGSYFNGGDYFENIMKVNCDVYFVYKNYIWSRCGPEPLLPQRWKPIAMNKTPSSMNRLLQTLLPDDVALQSGRVVAKLWPVVWPSFSSLLLSLGCDSAML